MQPYGSYDPAGGDLRSLNGAPLDSWTDQGGGFEELTVTQRVLLGAVAHDVAGVLQTVDHIAYLLRAHHDDEYTRQLAQRLQRQARAGRDLVEDLLSAERLRGPALATERRLTDLSELVQETLDGVETGERAVTVTVPTTEVMVDPTIVRRILHNLIKNVANHTHSDSQLWIRASIGGGGAVELTVEDDGPGLDTLDQGAGVGLRIVDSFARAHGGGAVVEPRPGGGARVKVRLATDGSGSQS